MDLDNLLGNQGGINGQKGVYHINAVDEITQWKIVASVERISEAYLVSVLEGMLVQFPFIIRGFHSDNASEFVNHVLAKLPKQTADPFHQIKAQT